MSADSGSQGASWRGEYHELRLRLYGLLLASDVCCIALAFLAANYLRFGDPLASYGANTFGVLFPIYVAIGLNGGAWTAKTLQNPRQSVEAAIKAFCFAIAVSAILFFSLKIGEDFSRLVFGLGSVISLLLVSIGRLLFGELIGRKFDWTFRKEVLLLDGAFQVPLRNELVVSAAHEGLSPAINDPDMLEKLARHLDRCERVTLACTPESRQAWLRMLAGANVDVVVTAPELISLGVLGLDRHGDTPTLLVARGPLGLRGRFLKRLLDLAVAGSAVLLLWPLFLIIPIAIRIESPGPVLFRQPRIGRGNRRFEMLKFRTMRQDAADRAGFRSTSRSDDRITKVGRFLRSTSLDELPQLMNVLKGQMSIVGPRPHAVDSRVDQETFWSVDNRYAHRHGIKPGMTGLAQVRGLRGATWDRSDLTSRLQADLEYLDGWHLGRDVLIIGRTLGVLVHPNAY